MTINLNVQTVHGQSHPVIVPPATPEEADSSEPPPPQQYRQETAERLEANNQASSIDAECCHESKHE